jgi:hypothetical protein
MKKLIWSLLVATIMFAFVYCLGAFYSISFDLTKWSESCRSLVTIMGGIFSLAFGGATYGILSEPNDN